MHLFRLHSYICTHGEGDPAKIALLCTEAGLETRIAAMISLGMFPEGREEFRNALVTATQSDDIGTFWRGVALVQRGAISSDSAERIRMFSSAKDMARKLGVTLDQEYIIMNAEAGLMVTGGRQRHAPQDIAHWMIANGVYQAPSVALAVMRDCIDANQRERAEALYRAIQERRRQRDANFSPKEMAYVDEFAQKTFR